MDYIQIPLKRKYLSGGKTGYSSKSNDQGNKKRKKNGLKPTGINRSVMVLDVDQKIHWQTR